MLEKIEGYPLVTKLRIIQIIEAYLNLYLKVKIGRQFTSNMELNRQFDEDMHGGRRNKSTQEAIIALKLLMDYSVIKQENIIITSVDAEKCYDRVSYGFAYLCMQIEGIDSIICDCLFKVLHQMKRSVLTKDGIS